ncbi:conserved hypothetical protein [Caldicellulosiruptor hydrothermalis 108]|uniref:Uncharacterized protein n=1 Tax=Caldicellulosiruptor hydrothermalis (strain DSM 18901 / VKM B-2411 / 108) TaxID=632292 RepID=E4QAC2_CALH1|nr:hypothetical protein [Caldicellulosiruptor hydrothermalis]ADQ08226.1 conserved hypothetical protein [Caldicellulosiruptor hydrothermalis 108]
MIKIKLNKKSIIALTVVVVFILVSVLGAIFYNENTKQDTMQNINSQPSTDTGVKNEKSNTNIDKLFNWMNVFKVYADATEDTNDILSEENIKAVPVWQPGEINPVIYQKNGKLYRLNDIPIETLVKYCRLLHDIEVVDILRKYNNSKARFTDRVDGSEWFPTKWGLLYRRIGQPFYSKAICYSDGYTRPVTFMEKMVTSWYSDHYNWFTLVPPIKIKYDTIDVSYDPNCQYISNRKRELARNFILVPKPYIDRYLANYPTYLPYQDIKEGIPLGGTNKFISEEEVLALPRAFMDASEELFPIYFNRDRVKFDITRAYTYLSIRFLKDFDTEAYNRLASVIKKYKMSLGKDAFVSVRMQNEPVIVNGAASRQYFLISLKFMYIKPTLDIKPKFAAVPNKKGVLYLIQLDPYTISFEKLYCISELYSKQDLRPLLTELGKIYKAIASGKIDGNGYFTFLKNVKLTSGQSNSFFKNMGKLGDEYLKLGKSKNPLYVAASRTTTFRAACLNYNRKYIVDIFYDILNTMGYLDDFKQAWNLGAKYASAVYNTPDPKTFDPINLVDYHISQDYYPTFIFGKVDLNVAGFNKYKIRDYKNFGKGWYSLVNYYVMNQAISKNIVNKDIFSKYYNNNYFVMPISTDAWATKDFKNLTPGATPHLHSIMIITGRYPDLDNNGKPYVYRSTWNGVVGPTLPIIFRLFPEFVNKDKTRYPYFAVESMLFDGISFYDKPVIPWSDMNMSKSYKDLIQRSWTTNLAIKSDVKEGNDFNLLTTNEYSILHRCIYNNEYQVVE